MYCITHGIEPIMKYSMYAKKNETKFKNNIYNPLNWKKDDKDNKICPMGYDARIKTVPVKWKNKASYGTMS